MIADLHTRNAKLIQELETLTEDNKTFKKVSSIIQYDKENARLRSELIILEKRLAATKASASIKQHKSIQPTLEQLPKDEAVVYIEIDKTCVHVDDPIEIAAEKAAIDSLPDQPIPDDHDDDNIQVYERKINKVIFYISDDSIQRIFEKKDDGEVGEELGRLEVVNGKRRPMWNHPQT